MTSEEWRQEVEEAVALTGRALRVSRTSCLPETPNCWARIEDPSSGKVWIVALPFERFSTRDERRRGLLVVLSSEGTREP